MPVPVLKSFVEKSGKSLKEVEELYAKAKDIVKDQYKISENNEKFFALVIGIVKKMLGIRDMVYVCENCWAVISMNDVFCNHCGSMLLICDEEGGQQTFTLKAKDVEVLTAFLQVSLRSKVVMNDLMRYIRGLTKAYTRGDSLNLQEYIDKAIQDNIKL